MKIENIKFKAIRLDGKGWVCGYFYEENGNTYIIENRQKESKLNRNLTYQVDPSTVCQFTGLKDSEGKEIWEGDIVHDSYDLLCIDNLYEVVYIEEEGTFAFKSLDKVDNYEPFVNLFEVYVVGNKFDKEQRMKNKILDLAKSAGWLVLIFIIGVIGFRISFSLGTPHEKEEFNIKIFTKKGHDYLIVDTKHGVCVIHAESCPCRKKKQRMENNMFEDIVAEGNIVVINNNWIVLCKCWKPEYHNLFCYLYLHKEYKNLMVGSHFTMTEDKKKSTRLATNEERLMLFEEMFKYGITFDKHEHRLIGKLVGV